MTGRPQRSPSKEELCKCPAHSQLFLREENKKKVLPLRAIMSLILSSTPHTHSGVWVLTRQHLTTHSVTESLSFLYDSFPVEAQFISCYSAGQVTFRLWHPCLFRYQAWFLSNWPVLLPLTSPTREPAQLHQQNRSNRAQHQTNQCSRELKWKQGEKNVA